MNFDGRVCKKKVKPTWIYCLSNNFRIYDIDVKNKAFTNHRSKREGLHFLSIKSPRYKANLFTPYQLATSAAKKERQNARYFLLSEAVLSQMSSEREQKYRVFAQLRFIKHRDCSFNVCFV